MTLFLPLLRHDCRVDLVCSPCLILVTFEVFMINRKNQGPAVSASLLFSFSEERVLRSSPKGTSRLVRDKEVHSPDFLLFFIRRWDGIGEARGLCSHNKVRKLHLLSATSVASRVMLLKKPQRR